jgi:hypothetical protein
MKRTTQPVMRGAQELRVVLDPGTSRRYDYVRIGAEAASREERLSSASRPRSPVPACRQIPDLHCLPGWRAGARTCRPTSEWPPAGWAAFAHVVARLRVSPQRLRDAAPTPGSARRPELRLVGVGRPGQPRRRTATPRSSVARTGRTPTQRRASPRARDPGRPMHVRGAAGPPQPGS